MVQISEKSRRKYWATRSSVRSFARTAHSFACSGLLASLAPSAALTRSLARSLRSLPRSWESEFLMSQNDLVLSHSATSDIISIPSSSLILPPQILVLLLILLLLVLLLILLFFFLLLFLVFLDATTDLYKRSCPSVRPSVFGPSVCPVLFSNVKNRGF